MKFSDYVYYAMFAFIFIEVLVVVIWRITCFFKKSCKWKKCPYRHEYHLSRQIGWLEKGCDKFPPTEEEIEEHEKMLDRLEELIEQLSKENEQSP